VTGFRRQTFVTGAGLARHALSFLRAKPFPDNLLSTSLPPWPGLARAVPYI
jgi:hypothetical protein